MFNNSKGILVRNARGIFVNAVKVETTTGWAGININGNSTRVTVQNSTIRDTKFEGIYIGTDPGKGIVDTTNDVEILRNDIIGSGAEAVEAKSNTHHVAITGNRVAGTKTYATGAIHVGSHYNNANMLISNNTVENTGPAPGKPVEKARAVGIHGSSDGTFGGITVSGNTIRNNFGQGIFLRDGSGFTLVNNTIRNNTVGSICLGGNVRNWRQSGNTFSGNGSAPGCIP